MLNVMGEEREAQETLESEKRSGVEKTDKGMTCTMKKAIKKAEGKVTGAKKNK